MLLSDIVSAFMPLYMLVILSKVCFVYYWTLHLNLESDLSLLAHYLLHYSVTKPQIIHYLRCWILSQYCNLYFNSFKTCVKECGPCEVANNLPVHIIK